jgi:shikimate dehydrogenase
VKLAVLGDPVSHSRSPAIHNAALAAAGISGVYEARRVDEAGVRNAFDELRSGVLAGFNVTMPHKGLAADLCDVLDTDASIAGSVNTVTMIDGAVWGFSTDIAGVRDAWGELKKTGPILVLGAGGAAAAACVALAGRPIYISTRRPGAGTELGSALAERGLAIEFGEVHWSVPVVAAVVVNCTPVGMHGEEIPADVLALSSGLFDMAYGPVASPAVGTLRSMGLPVVEGLDLLVAQAARSFRIWTGVAPPLADMTKAAKNP